jgi:hypothetical protein
MPDSIVERAASGRVNAFRNPLPGIPNIESPFFDDIFASMEISDGLMQVARELHEFGYSVIDFPDPEIAVRAERIKQSLYSHYDWDRWHAGRAGLRLQDAFKFDDDVRAIAANPVVIGVLSLLYGRRVFPFQTLNFPVGTQQHFHTDAVHFSCVPERFMCGVWVALEDVGPDQGPLIYYPGSHKWPIYTNEHLDVPAHDVTDQGIYEPVWSELIRVSGIEQKRFFPKRGQALIWTANLLHGGAPQANPNLTRWSQVTHYYFENCAYYTPMFSDPFNGKVLFREPTNIVEGGTVPNKAHGSDIALPFLRSMTEGPVTAERFDAAAYLIDHPDVAAADIDPWAHYCGFGRHEGRKVRLLPASATPSSM